MLDSPSSQSIKSIYNRASCWKMLKPGSWSRTAASLRWRWMYSDNRGGRDKVPYCSLRVASGSITPWVVDGRLLAGQSVVWTFICSLDIANPRLLGVSVTFV